VQAAEPGCGARQSVHKRYLNHVAGYNLGILMRALFGAGTPKEVPSFTSAFVFVIHAADATAIVVVAACVGEIAVLVLAIVPDAD
jgi:hypothetical protein